MEKITYEEAREWFWIRTWMWFLVVAVLATMAAFAYNGDLVKVFSPRLWISIAMGFGAPLVGLISASLSMQSPWMRLGWRVAFLLNGIAGVGMSVLIAFLSCGFVLSFMQSDVAHPPKAEDIQTAYSLMQFGIALAGLMGLVFGSWFALRRDKYFVEQF